MTNILRIKIYKKIFFIILLSLMAVVLVAFSKQFSSNNSLSKDLTLSMQGMESWFIKNQLSQGNFVYQRLVASGKKNSGNNIVRQAYILHVLSLVNKKEKDPKIKQTLQKGFAYFKTQAVNDNFLYKGQVVSTKKVVYHQTLNNNASALLALALIEYCEENPNDRKTYDSFINQLGYYLVSTQLPNGGFRYTYSLTKQDNFNNGETFYALTRLYQYTKNPLYLQSAKKAASYFMKTGYPATKKINKSYYTWGMQGFYFLHKINPDPTYWRYMKAYTNLFLKDVGGVSERYFYTKGAIAPPAPLAVYLEGLNYVAALAKDNDTTYAIRLEKLIRSSLVYLMDFQVNGPRSNKYSPYPTIQGGVCDDYYCNTQRIDTTGHNLSSIYLYLSLINK